MDAPSSEAHAMILVCYDGSEDAQAATDQVIRLFPERPATVLTVTEPYAEALMNSELGLGSGFGLGYERGDEVAELDAQRLQRAKHTAEEGARRLRAAGISADSLVEQPNGSIAETVLAVAERAHAEAVVAGTRGRGKAKSALLGSVSHDLLQHADRAVVIVPPAAVARRRRARFPRPTSDRLGSPRPAPKSAPQSAHTTQTTGS
jgi:nucleotide-binding universal stress UspA family protein